MSLSPIFGSGLSGLQAAQAGMRVVSQNIANANTTGYSRVGIEFESQGSGVAISAVRRAADRFLQAASLNGAAAQGASGVLSDLLDRAQSAFGDPTDSTSLFGTLGTMFTSFDELASDPSNALRKANAAHTTQTFFEQLRAVGQQLENMRLEADQRLADATAQANDLINRIAQLNTQIVSTKVSGSDASGVENAQSQLIGQLSNFMDIVVTPRDVGGVEVRTGAGAVLVSSAAANLQHTAISSPYGEVNGLYLIDRNGASHPLEGMIRSGTIAGLLQARDKDIPALGDALGALAGATADALNEASNQSTSVPPQTVLTGRQTGLASADLLGFSGKTTLAVTDPTGNLLHKVAIDFTARTYSVDGGAPTTWPTTETVGQFATAINSALGADGTMSFTGGVLTVTGGSSGNGVFFQDDATTPSSRGGRGFSQFFGLNDIVTRATPAFFDTGFQTTDPHGLTAGGAVGFRVLDANGREVLNRSVTVTGTTWGDMVTALNASGTGLGGYGSFGLDANGAMTATMASGYQIEVTSDTTQRGALSMSTLFGLTRAAQAGRATEMDVRQAIIDDPTKLTVARPDLSLAIGARVIESGDARGAAALANAGVTSRQFAAAGGLSAQINTLTNYASRVGGEAGRRATDAQNAKASAESVATAADARRSAQEGVQLDDELVKMTQYQQSYAAASRLVQAARDMIDILLQLK